MKNVTSSQTYQKGSWILHMLRGFLGNEVFWEGIKVYYNKYRDLNATTSDFKNIMEDVSNKDLNLFFVSCFAVVYGTYLINFSIFLTFTNFFQLGWKEIFQLGWKEIFLFCFCDIFTK